MFASNIREIQKINCALDEECKKYIPDESTRKKWLFNLEYYPSDQENLFAKINDPQKIPTIVHLLIKKHSTKAEIIKLAKTKKIKSLIIKNLSPKNNSFVSSLNRFDSTGYRLTYIKNLIKLKNLIHLNEKFLTTIEQKIEALTQQKENLQSAKNALNNYIKFHKSPPNLKNVTIAKDDKNTIENI